MQSLPPACLGGSCEGELEVKACACFSQLFSWFSGVALSLRGAVRWHLEAAACVGVYR